MNELFKALTSSSEEDEEEYNVINHKVVPLYTNLGDSVQNIVLNGDKGHKGHRSTKRKRNEFVREIGDDSGGGDDINNQKIKFTFGKKKKKKLKTVNLFEDLLSDDSELDEDTKKIEELLQARTNDSPIESTYNSPVNSFASKYDDTSFDDSFRPVNHFGYRFSSFKSPYSNIRDQHEVKPRACDVNMLRKIGLYNTLACRSRRWTKARRRFALERKEEE